ncbi:carbonic anhydrase [Homoserinimonas sp. OAct 916]|uniref:carbonic anhydrase n=1 Tax=Homoserinimonas sp. OAct 916 TaxID=2211450 RepID=UPI000DBE3604|nr:carbonic anhydrase [Homoserinimonas sp. OAct 916]
MSEPTTLTPGEVWHVLQEGNRRFIDGTPRHPRQDVERRTELAHRQYPVCAIFGCSDSRLAAEIIFDLGLGDAFVIRNVGQVNSTSVLGSIEYAVGVLHVPLVLVLGHDECGAVQAAIDCMDPDVPALPPHIDVLIQPIIPAVRRAAGVADGAEVDTSLVDPSVVGREHLRETVAELLSSSEMISDAVADGTLAIVGANYVLQDGRVVSDIVVGNA